MSEPTHCTPYPNDAKDGGGSNSDDDIPELVDLELVDEDGEVVIDTTIMLNGVQVA